MEKLKIQDRAFVHSGTVAIIGPSNAGKSTLLNAFLGQKLSIVTSKPQTTRNRISGILNQEDAQILFIDTPGIHQAKDSMNHYIVNMARQALWGTDIVILLLDGARYTKHPDRFDMDMSLFRQELLDSGGSLVVGLNKADLMNDKRDLLPLIEQCSALWPDAELFPVSAHKEINTESLKNFLVQTLPQGPPLFPEDQLSTLPMRFLASEIIREKLFQELRQELPYSIAVEIDHWEEVPERDLVIINGLIYVSRNNHKQIVIGHKGSLLKKIGQRAREELILFIGQRVHLQLWVKVRPQWNEDKRLLAQLIPDI